MSGLHDISVSPYFPCESNSLPLFLSETKKKHKNKMGFPPELPSEEDKQISALDVPDQNHPMTDDDEEIDGNPYNGYEPLQLSDFAMDENEDSDLEDDEDVDTVESIKGSTEEPSLCEGNDLPKITSVDQEIESEIWGQPRPKELEIPLDTNKTEQILTAMSTIKLPNAAIPNWAKDIPEESWKNDLLQRIRERKTE
ncbi:hypothetical protein ACFFRR_003747 [Megaselia abdita]